MHTVQQAAAKLKRPYRTVAHWCHVHGIGQMLSPRLRLISEEDLRRLKEVAKTTVRGRPREDKGS